MVQKYIWMLLKSSVLQNIIERHMDRVKINVCFKKSTYIELLFASQFLQCVTTTTTATIITTTLCASTKRKPVTKKNQLKKSFIIYNRRFKCLKM